MKITYLILNIYLNISFYQLMDYLDISFFSSNDQGSLTILISIIKTWFIKVVEYFVQIALCLYTSCPNNYFHSITNSVTCTAKFVVAQTSW